MLFAEEFQPPQQQPTLVVMRSADDPASAKVIFDPNTASSKGSLAVDFYRAFVRRQVCCGGAFREWLRRRFGPRLRSRHRQGTFRRRAARELRHRRRQHRLEGRQLRLLLHALSAGQRASGGRRQLLPAGLFSQARHRCEAGHLRHRQRFSAHRRDSAPHQRRRTLAARRRRQRRWRPIRALPNGCRRPLDADHALRRWNRLR